MLTQIIGEPRVDEWTSGRVDEWASGRVGQDANCNLGLSRPSTTGSGLPIWRAGDQGDELFCDTLPRRKVNIAKIANIASFLG